MLADKGQIIVEVPNADDVLLTLYQSEAFSHFTYWSCHLFLYTAKTLQMLFDQMNLKVNYIKQVQKDTRYQITCTGWRTGALADIKNGIFLILQNCMLLMKNNLPRLENVTQLLPVFHGGSSFPEHYCA